jgi:hypothetical protein
LRFCLFHTVKNFIELSADLSFFQKQDYNHQTWKIKFSSRHKINLL